MTHKTQIFVLCGTFLQLHTEQFTLPQKPPFSEQTWVRGAPVSLQSPSVFPLIPPPSLPTAPVPEAQHDPVWAGKRARGSGREAGMF